MILGIYNIWNDRHGLVLIQGEEVCLRCTGTGVKQLPEHMNLAFPYLMCGKCFGTGKVDWITNIMR